MREQLWFAILIGVLIVGILAAAALLTPSVRRRIGRRGVGAFSDEVCWRAAMERKATALLHRMPFFPEEDTLALHRSGKGRQTMRSRRAARLLLAAGLYEERNPALFQAGKAYLATLFTENGEWKVPIEQAENALLAYAVLSYPGTDLHVVRPAMEQTALLLQALAGESGTIPPNSQTPSLRLAQTIEDVCPFLAAYAAAYGEPFYLNLAMRQIDAYLLNGMHPAQGLPAQGFDCGGGLPIGAYGWSGACASLAFGMMETGRYLPVDDGRKVKLLIHSRLLAERLLALWAEDGSFPRLPFAALSDTQAAAVLSAFLWDAYQRTQEEAYLACVRRAMDDLRKRTRKNGMVDFGQPESLRPGFYCQAEAPTAGALAAALYAAVKTEGKGP